ncbi:MAG: histidinol phosphate phosphatase domain-containing protein [Spirochaetales bacterium]|nr:histidinol phosphate phosphatase domain-containing protein [Spirochaetales bacterium]
MKTDQGIIDLHTHTFFSDGVLSPAELVRRAEYSGYSAIAITDHVDASNIEHVLSGIIEFCKKTRPFYDMVILPGVEITHVPPKQIKSLVSLARSAGAAIIVLHGETICEPVPPGTNLAGIEAGIDILAHPGLITEAEVKLAAEQGVYLEISGRHSHGLGNGRVLHLARKLSARCVLDTDTHAPKDLFTPTYREKVALGAGMTAEEYELVKKNMQSIVKECIAKI